MSYQKRRLEIQQHEAWLKSIASPQPETFDMIDELVADAELDLQPRSEKQAGRILSILDDITVETLRSKNYEERGAE